MNVMRFSGTTSREAMRKVREALGPSAVILSNRATEGGVELLALASADVPSIAAPGPETAPAASPAPPSTRPPEGMNERLDASAAGCGVMGADRPIKGCPPELLALKNEVRSLRGMLESQLAELSWDSLQKREPARAALLREMLASGFSPSLSRHLIDNMPAHEAKRGGLDWLRSVLALNLTTGHAESDIVEKGGIYAFVGPTGVGKTTTAAKLAARCVIRQGASSLALITADGYRIGGHEQLRIYGKILGVMVHSVRDEADLRIALSQMKNKQTVLIDTAGVGQRNQMVAEQAAMLSCADAEVQRMLCLCATSTGETLNEVIRAYQGDGLAGSIITKLDEAATLGNVLDAVIRHRLTLNYVANGQRVPEDIHVANPRHLIDMAFKLRRETAPFLVRDDELPLIMATTGRLADDPGLKELALG